MSLGFSDETIKALVAHCMKDGNGWHITRNFMYRSLGNAFAKHDAPEKDCLVISNSEFFGRILGLKACRYTRAAYPEHNMLDLRFEDDRFDFCISDQVLEHIEGDPFTAFRETVRVVRPGGHLCHTTCLINPVHRDPSDFWRFTVDALKLLATASGCEIVLAAGWGNREAWAVERAGFRMTRIPEDPSNPIFQLAQRNDPDWPIVTWIIARKPDGSLAGR